MVTAQSGRYQNIQFLIAANADVNLRDADGWTALLYSVHTRPQSDIVP
jgi:ankyrin repeat protein